MKLKEVIQMMKMYASCPVCGEENVGEENGEIEIDTKRGYFKRSYKRRTSFKSND